jgi:ABC-type branched-subunit amino acid transport system substrate-binding protein
MTGRRRHGRRRSVWAVLPATAMLLTGSVGLVAVSVATAAATKSPIIIGGVASATDFPGTNFGFEARIARLNKAGGVNGHPVQFVGNLDDGGSSSTNLTDVQQLVLKDHVVAIVPVASVGLLASSAAFLAAHKTPFIGWGFLSTYCNNKWGWGFNGCLEPAGIYNLSLLDPLIKAAGISPKQVRFGDIENNNASGISAANLYANLVKILGGTTVYNSYSLPFSGITDYSSYVSALLATHPNVVNLGAAFGQTVAIRAALTAAGFKGATMDSYLYVPGLLASQPSVDAAVQGEYVYVQFPPQEEQSPAVKQLSKDLVAVGQSPTISEGDAIGYWSADVLVQILQATAKAGRPLTGAGLERTVNAGFTYKGTLAGGIGAAVFPHAEGYPVPCAALVQIKGTAYKVAEPFACYKDIKAK